MNSKCSVCVELVRSTDSQKPFVTPCGHLFHENCIKNCLQNISHGKCPQCNQSIMSSQLIRLFVNEPENSNKVKDVLIEQLHSQLNELRSEKVQLQYHLTEALNQAHLSKGFSRNEECRWYSQSKTKAYTFNAPTQRFSGFNAPTINYGSLGNAKNSAGKSVFTFGGTNSNEVQPLGATDFNVSTWCAPLKSSNVFGIDPTTYRSTQPNTNFATAITQRRPSKHRLSSNSPTAATATKRKFIAIRNEEAFKSPTEILMKSPTLLQSTDQSASNESKPTVADGAAMNTVNEAVVDDASVVPEKNDSELHRRSAPAKETSLLN